MEKKEKKYSTHKIICPLCKRTAEKKTKWKGRDTIITYRLCSPPCEKF